MKPLLFHDAPLLFHDAHVDHKAKDESQIHVSVDKIEGNSNSDL